MKRKPTFLNQNKPLITCMIQADNPTDAIHTIREAQFEGADAYGFQMEVMKKEFRTEEQVKGIFREAEQRHELPQQSESGRQRRRVRQRA